MQDESWISLKSTAIALGSKGTRLRIALFYERTLAWQYH